MEEIKLYDFKKSEKFSIENIKHLILISEEFCKTSNMQIGYEVKNENLRLSIKEAGQSTYSEFIEKISNESVVIEYDVAPLVSNLSLFIDKSVVLSLVDLLLGGNGKVSDDNRDLTEIDLELFKYLIDKLLKRMYIPYKYEEIEIVNIYTNKVQYQKLNNKNMIFETTIDVKIEENIIGSIRLCIPYKSMEEVINDLASKNFKIVDKFDIENKDISLKANFDFTKSIDIDVCAKLGTTKISINDLLNLESGDVVMLDQRICDDITVAIGKTNVYKAKPGIVGIKKGIEITEIVNEER